MAAPSAGAFNLAKAMARGMYFMPQSGAGISRAAGMCSSAWRIRAATVFRALRLRVPHADNAENDGLVAKTVEGPEVEVGLRRLDRDLLGDRAGQFGQERVSARLAAGDISVAEAQVQRRRPGRITKRPVVTDGELARISHTRSRI
jgi:hypothetical protein